MRAFYGYVDIGSMGIVPLGSRTKDNSFLDFWKSLYLTDNGSQSGVFEVKHDLGILFEIVVKTGYGWIKIGDNIRDCLPECLFIIGVGHSVSVIQHNHPDFAILYKAVVIGLFDDFSGETGIDTLFLQIILEGLPGQFKGVFKSLDHSLFLQVGQVLDLNDRALELEIGLFEVLKTLFPANVTFVHHALSNFYPAAARRRGVKEKRKKSSR